MKVIIFRYVFEKLSYDVNYNRIICKSSESPELSLFLYSTHLVLHMSVNKVDITWGFFFQDNDEDVSQFDTEFTHQTPVDSPDDLHQLSESANNVFLVRKLIVYAMTTSIFFDVLSRVFIDSHFIYTSMTNVHIASKFSIQIKLCCCCVQPLLSWF